MCHENKRVKFVGERPPWRLRRPPLRVRRKMQSELPGSSAFSPSPVLQLHLRKRATYFGPRSIAERKTPGNFLTRMLVCVLVRLCGFCPLSVAAVVLGASGRWRTTFAMGLPSTRHSRWSISAPAPCCSYAGEAQVARFSRSMAGNMKRITRRFGI
jgi:hypothetical protein